MVTTIEALISIQKTVFDQAKILAQRLNISQNELFETAIGEFIRSYQNSTLPRENNKDDHEQPALHHQSNPFGQDAKTAMHSSSGRKVINQGDIYWVRIEKSRELESGIAHPYVVIQDNLFNHSRINTVVACALTSNIKRVSDTPGNILLDASEANLPRQSVVEVSKISTVDKAVLGEYIGSLSEQRINEIVAGIRFLQTSYFTR